MTGPKMSGELVRWGNVSTQQSPTVYDGIEVEDLRVILENLRNHFKFEEFLQIEDDLYKHTIDFNNPHNTTADLLPESVIESLYESWLGEGYRGSLEDLRIIIYRFIVMATLDDFIYLEDPSLTETQKEIYEHIIPPVKVLYDYLQRHNKSLEAHDKMFSNVFIGAPVDNEPLYCFSYMFGFPDNFSAYDWYGTYYKIPFIDGNISAQDGTTIVVELNKNIPSAWIDYIRLGIDNTITHNFVLYSTNGQLIISVLGRDTVIDNIENLNKVNKIRLAISIRNYTQLIVHYGDSIKIYNLFPEGNTTPNFKYVAVRKTFSVNGLQTVTIYPKAISDAEIVKFLSA